MYSLTHEQLAWRIAEDLPQNARVYLGTGTPQQIPVYALPENGLQFFAADSDDLNHDSVTFDFAIFTATQVAENGDFASTHSAAELSIISRTKHVLVLMDYFASDGNCNIVSQCSLPLSAQRCVSTIYTEIGLFDLIDGKVVVCEIIEGITLYTLLAETPVPLQVAPQVRLFVAPTKQKSAAIKIITNATEPLDADAVPVHSRKTIYPQPFAAQVEGRIKHRLGDHFGLTNFGVNLTELAPGAASALLHHHSKQDEFIYIVSGAPTLVFGDKEYLLKTGACCGFKAGTGLGHQLVNRTSAVVLYLEIGDRTAGDYATYPNDDLKFTQLDDGAWILTHKDGSLY